MKKRNNTLEFTKSSITELNDAQTFKVMGGTNTTDTTNQQTTIQCSHCIPDTSVRISVIDNQGILKN